MQSSVGDAAMLEVIAAPAMGRSALPVHATPVRRPTPVAAVSLGNARRGVPDSRDSYLAYFRGYRRPSRYWEGPDGLRYWRTRFELNRCTPDSVEPPRRVDQGARPILDWDGPPHAPNGIGLYVREPDGRWWPHFDGTEYEPCRGCQRRPVAAASAKIGS